MQVRSIRAHPFDGEITVLAGADIPLLSEECRRPWPPKVPARHRSQIRPRTVCRRDLWKRWPAAEDVATKDNVSTVRNKSSRNAGTRRDSEKRR